MKKVAKQAIRFINDNTLNLYLKLIYKWNIKNKLLKSSDTIKNTYKKDIQKYWRQFNVKVSTDWHKWYSSRNGIKDVRYIPEDIFYSIIEPFYNRVDFKQAYGDKSLHSIFFKEIKRPLTIAKNINGIFYDDSFNLISYENIINRCINVKQVVIKPTIDSGGGRNIFFIDGEKVNNMEEEIAYVISKLKQDYIIQQTIQQHNDLKKIHPQSVNTIRVISFFFKGEVHILSSVLRMGINSLKVDNQAAGGISVGITEHGFLKKYAYNKYGETFLKHPQGFEFYGNKVPAYDKILKIIMDYHKRFGYFKIISWDFAIDVESNPILIEYNLRFQELNFHQINNGPLFGELTDQVLKEVFGRR